MDTVYELQPETCRFLGVCGEKFPLRLDWSASGLEFYTAAKNVTAVISGYGNEYQDVNISYLGVFADGKLVQKIPIERQQKEYDIFHQEGGNRVLLRLVKLTEKQYDSLEISSVKTDGACERPEERSRKLFFIGDSITAGYGIEDTEGNHVFSTADENVTMAYAYRTAEMLQADCGIVCESGDGIISRWIPEEDDVPNTFHLLPDIFPYEDVRPARVLVSYVGTNDAAYIRSLPERESAFQASYGAFLKRARKALQAQQVLLLSGAMESTVNPVVERLSEAEGYSYLCFPLQDMKADGFSTDTHPSAKTQEKMALLLAEKLQKIISQ